MRAFRKSPCCCLVPNGHVCFALGQTLSVTLGHLGRLLPRGAPASRVPSVSVERFGAIPVITAYGMARCLFIAEAVALPSVPMLTLMLMLVLMLMLILMLLLTLMLILLGKGWYDYEKGSRKPLHSPEVAALIDAHRTEMGRYVLCMGAVPASKGHGTADL